MKQNRPQSAPKKSLFRRMVKWLFFVIIFMVVLVGGALLSVEIYLNSDSPKKLEGLPFIESGVIAYQKADVQFLKNFPSISVHFEDVLLKPTSPDGEQPPILFFENLTVEAALKELFFKNIELKKLDIDGGHIHIHSDSTGRSNLSKIFGDEKDETDGETTGVSLEYDQSLVSISNLEVQFIDELKGRNMQGKVEQLSIYLQKEEEKLTVADGAMRLAVKELTFDERKGAFIPNSKVNGQFRAQVRRGQITVEPFDIMVNEEKLCVSADIYPGGNEPSVLNFENPHTRYDKIVPLLPFHIQEKLKNYDTPQPFYATAEVRSRFGSGNRSLVSVNFEVDENDVEVFGYRLKNGSCKGKFVNYLYDDDRKWEEERGNFRLVLTDVKSNYRSFEIQSDNVKIQRIKADGDGPTISAKVMASGNPRDFNQLLGNDEFFFRRGNFKLNAQVEGKLKEVDDLIVKSDAQLSLTNFSVYYQPAQVTFPFTVLDLEKKAGDAFFTITNNTFVEGHTIMIDGGLKNFPALLVDLIEQQVSSDVKVVAQKLTWKDFVELFGENGYLENGDAKSDEDKKRSMKATLAGLYYNFQPRISVEVDTLEYSEKIRFFNFKSGVHFSDSATIVLEKTSFDFDGSQVNFSGRLDIGTPDYTPFEFVLDGDEINLHTMLPKFNFFNLEVLREVDELPKDITLHIEHEGVIDDRVGLMPNTNSGKIRLVSKQNKSGLIEVDYLSDYSQGVPAEHACTNTHLFIQGDPVAFNDFFHNEDFFFRKGLFQARLGYFGKFESKADIIENSNIEFSLIDSEVEYEPGSIVFPLTEIMLHVKNNQADFDFMLSSKELGGEINFNGKLYGLSDLVVGNSHQPVRAVANLYSPRLSANQFMLLSTGKKKGSGVTDFKKSIIGLMNEFNPSIDLRVDTLLYGEKLTLHHFVSGLHLLDSSTLVLEKTGFEFLDGSLKAQGQITIEEGKPMPVDFNLTTTHFDIGELLERLDYLDLAFFDGIEILEGEMDLDLDYSGTIGTGSGGELNSLNKGRLHFELSAIQLMGLAKLDSITEKYFMHKRFEHLLFAPVKGNVSFQNEAFEFDRFEIQSNALQVFVEGEGGSKEGNSIWLAVPISNLKKNDRSVVPEKTGYWKSGRKIFIEIAKDKKGELKLKPHLTNKKWYKDRGIIEQYKKDKKYFRSVRKALRKERRRSMKK